MLGTRLKATFPRYIGLFHLDCIFPAYYKMYLSDLLHCQTTDTPHRNTKHWSHWIFLLCQIRLKESYLMAANLFKKKHGWPHIVFLFESKEKVRQRNGRYLFLDAGGGVGDLGSSHLSVSLSS